MNRARWHGPVEAAAAVLAALTAAHLWTPLDNAVGLGVQTALSVSAWRAAAAVDSLPGFESVGDGWVLVRGSAAALGLAALLFAGRGGGLRAWPGHAASIVPLLGLLAVIAYGGGLAPTAWLLTVLLAGALGAPRGRRGEAAHLGVTAAAGWAGCAAFLLLHALYVSGPGIQPALVADGGVGAFFADLLDPLTGSPLLRVALQAGVLVGLVLASRSAQAKGLPLIPRVGWGPSGWLAPVAHLAAIAAVSAVPAQLLSVWKCPPPSQAGPVTRIDDRPGSFQIHLVDSGRALWSVDREASATHRWSIPDGRPLPDIDWRAFSAEAWPEEQIPVDGGVWTALVDPDLPDSSLLRRVDLDGRLTGSPVVTDGCYVASWAPLADGRLLLGCEYEPEFIVLEGATGAILDRFVVPQAGSFEEIVLDPGGLRAYTVPLWFGARLTEVDLATRRATASMRLGDFNWGAARSGGRLFVSRFQEGRLLSVDLASRKVLDAVHVGYGARPVVVRPGGRWVIAAGTYSGALTAAEVQPDGTFGRTERLPVGGLVRSLAASQDGASLYFAGRCGLRRLDLTAWLGAEEQP